MHRRWLDFSRNIDMSQIIKKKKSDYVKWKIWKNFLKDLILHKKHVILLNVEKTHKGSVEGSAEEVLKNAKNFMESLLD